MVTLPAPATEKDVLDLVHRWIELLAAERYRDAYDLTAHDPYYQWSPDVIRATIEGYGLPEPGPDGSVYRVTPLDSAMGDAANDIGPRYEVVLLEHPATEEDAVIGEVWFDLPLNGRWSDLTATFEVCQKRGAVHLVLNEIHVF